MIQVVYCWEVPVASQAAFLAAWEETTVRIRESTEGARGSFCVVGVEDPTEILTIARWDTLEQWQAFVANANVTSMQKMHALGTRRSATAYRQVGDYTV